MNNIMMMNNMNNMGMMNNNMKNNNMMMNNMGMMNNNSKRNNKMMNNMGMMNQFPGINGYYNPMMQANYQSYLPQGFVPPSNKSTLTDEEIKRIREASKNIRND